MLRIEGTTKETYKVSVHPPAPGGELFYAVGESVDRPRDCQEACDGEACRSLENTG